ncbi:alpha/beta hydrolase [Microbulbifer elongatus]|uniref:alpha/beta hydrolase n=1 Tax=Microbulbifer elongatus TaxID=86173 RepID=UPI001E606FF8|nr:alpha/beta hydrolase [Microbulbifer elongatus]
MSKQKRIVNRLKPLFLAAAMGVLGSSAGAEQPEQSSGAPLLQAPLVSEPCYGSGWSDALHCYRVPVTGPQAGQGAELAVLVAPALNGGQREPLYMLAGGPGQAASDLVRLLNPLRKINRERDVVFVDRRGAGLSDVFDCGISDSPPADLQHFSELIAQCYTRAAERPLTLHSRQTVEDLEQVRKALGHDKISLWGGSWGTRTALLYQQWYPDSLVSLVLDGVAPIESKVFLTAQEAESALRQLEQDCAEDPVCREFGDWRAALDQILATWDRARAVSFPDPFTGFPSQEPVEGWVLANAVRTALYDPGAAAQLPFAVDQAAQGNLMPLAGIVGLFAAMEGGMAMGLTFSVACAEEMQRISEDEIAADSAGTFLGNAFLQPFIHGCAKWPVPPRDYAPSEPRAHPVLLISGSADPITPPHYAEEALGYLENSQHLIVPGGGHINSARGCIPDLILEFLDGESAALDQRCVADIQRPPFMAAPFGPEFAPPQMPQVARDEAAQSAATRKGEQP